MRRPGAKGPLRPVLRRGALRELLRRSTERALRLGALQPIPTDFELVEEEGISFLVRVLGRLARKDEERWRREREARERGEEVNPFLPYDEDLFVADLSETHLCLLNKYNVVDEHLLIVTRRFEDQDEYPGEDDFAALLAGPGEYESLAFYNGGTVGGASQRHKHLQLVPLPLVPGGAAVPVVPALRAARFEGDMGVSPRLPFRHVIAPMAPFWTRRPRASAEEAASLFGEMLVAAGMERSKPLPGARQSGPYNLLATREWMLLVPRSKECFDGVSVNSLGFAGALLVRDGEQLRRLKEKGPLAALAEVSLPKG